MSLIICSPATGQDQSTEESDHQTALSRARGKIIIDAYNLGLFFALYSLYILIPFHNSML